MSEPAAAGKGAAGGSDSSWGRLVGALVAPGKTFRAIAARPTWGVALAFLVVLAAVVTFVIFQKVDFDQAMREQLARQGREVPAGAPGGGFMKGCAMVSALVVPAAFYLAAAALFLLFNLFGGQLKYKTSLAVTLHAVMPRALAALLTLPVAFSRGAIDLEEMQYGGGLLRSNLAFLAPEGASAPLLVLLASLDLFTIWTLALLILGFHLAARVSKATAATVVLAAWAVLVAAQAGFSLLRPGG